MNQLICEMCQSTDLIKQNGVFVCQNCGTKYSVEDARKMMNGSSAAVVPETTVNKSNIELTTLYSLARRARSNNDIEGAANYYEQIIVKDPDSWEANFYAVLFRAKNCKIASIASSAALITNNEKSTLELIKENVAPNEQLKIVSDIFNDINSTALMLLTATENTFTDTGASIMGNYTGELETRAAAIFGMLERYAKLVIDTFGDDAKSIALECDKALLDHYKQFADYCKQMYKIASSAALSDMWRRSQYVGNLSEIRDKYYSKYNAQLEKIKRYDHNYQSETVTHNDVNDHKNAKTQAGFVMLFALYPFLQMIIQTIIISVYQYKLIHQIYYPFRELILVLPGLLLFGSFAIISLRRINKKHGNDLIKKSSIVFLSSYTLVMPPIIYIISIVLIRITGWGESLSDAINFIFSGGFLIVFFDGHEYYISKYFESYFNSINQNNIVRAVSFSVIISLYAFIIYKREQKKSNNS